MVKLTRNLNILVFFNHVLTLYPYREPGIVKKSKPVQIFHIIRMVIIDLAISYSVLVHISHVLSEDLNLNDMVFVGCTFPILLAVADAQLTPLIAWRTLDGIIISLGRISEKLDTKLVNRINSIIGAELIVIFSTFSYLFCMYFVYWPRAEAIFINLGYTLTKLMIITNTYFIVACLLIIEHNFAQLNRILTGSINSSFDFRAIYKVYSELVELSKNFNQLYGRQFLLANLVYVIWSIYEMYHFVILISFRQHFFVKTHLIVLALSYALLQEITLFVVLAACHFTKKEADKFKISWFSTYMKHYQGNPQFETLSLALMHQEVEFTAMGFYPLDMSYFLKMLGSLATLIVILTQFSTTP